MSVCVGEGWGLESHRKVAEVRGTHTSDHEGLCKPCFIPSVTPCWLDLPAVRTNFTAQSNGWWVERKVEAEAEENTFYERIIVNTQIGNDNFRRY